MAKRVIFPRVLPSVKSALLVLFLALAPAARADFLVSGFSSNAVYRYDDTGAQLGTNPFIATGSGPSALNLPHRVFVAPNGNLLVASAANDRVLRYNGSTGAFIDAFIPTGSGGLDYPVDMTIGPDGALYVSSQLSDTVLRYDATTGAFLSTFATIGSAAVSDGPSGIVFLNGDLFVACRFSNQLYRYDSNGQQVGAGAFATYGSSAFGLEVGADNKLYVVTGQSVLRYDPPVTGNAATTFVTAGSGGLNGAIGLDFGPNNGLYLTSFNTNTVIKYDATTGGSPATFVSAGSGGLNGPNFLTYRPVPEPVVAIYSLIGIAMLSRRLTRRRRAAA